MKKTLSLFITLTLLFGVVSVFSTPKTAEACYPAYKCMSKSSLPKDYKLYFSNKDRSLGVYYGTLAVGAAGLIPGVGVSSFLAAAGIGAKELISGYMSYKVYIKRSPDSGEIGRLKTVYYKDKNFKGKTKTVYQDF